MLHKGHNKHTSLPLFAMGPCPALGSKAARRFRGARNQYGQAPGSALPEAEINSMESLPPAVCLWSTVLVAAVGCGRALAAWFWLQAGAGVGGCGCDFVVVIPIVLVKCFCCCSLLLVSAGVVFL